MDIQAHCHLLHYESDDSIGPRAGHRLQGEEELAGSNASLQTSKRLTSWRMQEVQGRTNILQRIASEFVSLCSLVYNCKMYDNRACSMFF